MKALIFMLALNVLVFCDSFTESQKNTLHFAISGGFTLMACASTKLALRDTIGLKSCVIGSTLGIMPGLAKEIIDYKRGFVFSVPDLGYDLLGIAAGCAIYYCIDRFILKGIKNGRESKKISFTFS